MARDTTKQQHWAGHIEAWRASGLSQRAYCAQANIKWPTFNYWRQQLLPLTVAPSPSQPAAPANPGGLTFIPLRITPPSPAISADPFHPPLLTLRSPSGWQLTLQSTPDTTWLARLLRELP
jgi:hypothetical protein